MAGEAQRKQPQFSLGYDDNFLSTIDEDFMCSICHGALRQPVLTRCGHRFCRECLEQCFARQQDGQQKSLPCPVDRVDLVPEKDVFPDKATERKILSLAISCPSEGCDWTGELRNKEIHLASCNFKLISCTNENCEMKVSRKDLEEHATKECQWRTVHCDYCHELYPTCQMEEHLQTCKKFPVQCAECSTVMQYEEAPEHYEKVCPRAVIQCPYYPMGCNVKMQREMVDFHLESSARLHLDLACVKLNEKNEEFQETTKKLEAKIDALQKQQQFTGILNRNLSREVMKLKQESPPFVWKITGIKGLLKEAKKGIDTTLESNGFSTGPAGYRLCVVLYPNGIKENENTHMSVFISLMKGKYDAILQWPFRKTVTFTLIDQQKNELHAINVVEKLIPDPADACFARPVNDYNWEYGIPAFVSHEDLLRRRYVVDDTIFLKVQCGPQA